ncbi:MAG: hypothetical protein ACI8PT_002819 [Gammaproteobacteria bacterium]|jgi:hypothetical protein
MARLSYRDAQDLPEDQRDVPARLIDLIRLLNHNPSAARELHPLGHGIRYDAKTDFRRHEFAILTVGYLDEFPPPGDA